jgi:hypothetical protein
MIVHLTRKAWVTRKHISDLIHLVNEHNNMNIDFDKL